jgi:hypothetical protein
MPYGSWSPQCAICKQSVNLEQSKTDENGSAVHEDCYVSLFISTKPRLYDGTDWDTKRAPVAVVSPMCGFLASFSKPCNRFFAFRTL